MKRIIIQCVAAAICVLFASCGGGTSASAGKGSLSPSEVVDQSNKALIKGDIKTYVKIAFGIPDKLEQGEAKEVEELTQFLTQSLASAKDADVLVKYKITGEKISENGYQATVNVLNTYKDGKEKAKEVRLTKKETGWAIELFQ